MRLKLFLSLFVLGLFLKFASPALAAPTIDTITVQPPGTTVQQYTKFEIGFPITTVATNPFYVFDANPPAGVERANNTGIGITVDMLILPSNQTNWANAKTQACFWFQPYQELGSSLVPTGKAEWRCRVGPDTIGSFKYKIRATDASGTTESAENTFIVTTNTSTNFTKKGYVKVSTRDPRFFEYSDGSAFYTPLVNIEVNDFNSLSGIRSNISDLSQNGMRFVRWFPTAETGVLYSFGGWVYLPGEISSVIATKFDDVDAVKGKKVSLEPDTIYWTQAFTAVPNGQYRLTLRAHVTGSRQFRATVSFAGGNSQVFTIPADATCTTINTCFKDYSFSITNSNSSQNTVSVNLSQSSATGTVRISDVVFQRLENKTGESGLWGGNLLHLSDGDTYSYVDQVQAAKMDEVMRQSETLGVYHKMTLIWKEDYVLWRLSNACTISPGGWWLGLVDPNCSTWYQKNYLRYFMARWSYSTAFHSLEYANEHDPGSWLNSATMSNYARNTSFRKVLMTNSYYHWGGCSSTSNCSISTSAWTDPAIDYVDRHWYANSGGGGPEAGYSDQKSDPTQYSRECAAFAREYNQANNINKPFVQGEGGSMLPNYAEDPDPANDSYGNWFHKKLWANVGALGYTCDGEWWPHPGDSFNSPLFPMYKAYSAFLDNEPLSNGSHVEIGTDNLNYNATASCSSGNNCITNSNFANLRAFGSKDTVTRRVLVWIDNKNNTWAINPAGATAATATFSISGMPNATYTQEVWDTRAGTKITTPQPSPVTITNGTLTFSATTGKDVAYKFYDPNVVIPSPSPGVSPSPAPSPVPGDINGDHVVNANDLKLVLSNFIGSTICQTFTCDVSGDGKVNLFDAVWVVKNFGLTW